MWMSFAHFELRYYLKQPSFYVTTLIFFALAFFAASTEVVKIGGGAEVLENGPYAVFRTVGTMLIFAMFLVVNFVGSAAIRNQAHGMEELVYSKPVSSFHYQLGRFIGSTVVVMLVFMAVPLGSLLGSLMPWVDPMRYGPVVLGHYVSAYWILALPSIYVLSALFFAVAHFFRSMMALYLTAVVLLICFVMVGNYLDTPDLRQIAALGDPFGFLTFGDFTRYWTVAEKNERVVEFAGVLLQNRLLWLGIGTLIFLAFGGLFRGLKLAARPAGGKAKTQAVPQISLNALQHASQTPSMWAQFWLRTRFELKQIIFSAPFLVLLLLALFDLSAPIFDPQGRYDVPNLPLTQIMVDLIVTSTGLLLTLVTVYYCAEVVWRERSTGMGDIIDATPAHNLVFWASKLCGVMSVFVLMYISFALATIGYQSVKGVEDLDLVQYLVRLGYFQLLPCLYVVILAFLLQVISPNKYVGMFLFVLYFIATQTLTGFDFSHNMYHYSFAPAAPFSDLNRFGWTLTTQHWYMLYWGALALVFFVLGYGLYQRGPAQPLALRFKQLRYQLGAVGQSLVLCGALVFVSSGGWIYYNTRVLNHYVTNDELMDMQADYEKAFKQYENDPLLVATDVKLQVEIYPQQGRMKTIATQIMVNKFDKPLQKLLVNYPSDSTELTITAPGATLSKRDRRFEIAWLEFATPIQPGQQVEVQITAVRQHRGFVDVNADNLLVENGTFLNNQDLLGVFGYQSSRLLQDRHERAKRDLAPIERLPKLEDTTHHHESGFGRAEDFINFEATIGTDADQTAIAPGYLQKQWQDNGRAYFHYKMDKPMFNFYSVLSARLAVKKEVYKGVSLEIYYHPTHAFNLDTMMQSLKDSLDYFNEAFGPYQHQQMRIIEFPGYRRFAQSFANTVPYSELIGFTSDLSDPSTIDLPYYVTAHEMAHQWWGHQVGTANVQGSQVIPESLAQYSALRVMERKYGETKLRKFLRFELDRYLRDRGTEKIGEQPLLRAENQNYIHYQKGSVVMMAIKDRIGAATLDAGLKAFAHEFLYKQDPYPTTLDLVRHIKAGVSTEDQRFIDQLFNEITLYDLRLIKVEKTELANQRQQLTLTIDAKRQVADAKGKESEQPLDEWVEIGVFSQDPDDFSMEQQPLYLQKHRLYSGEQRIQIEVPTGGAFVGVDPLIKFIDRDSVDNTQAIK